MYQANNDLCLFREESYSDYDIFMRVTKRKSRKVRNRLRKTATLPDPHKAQLIEEVVELKVKSPSIWRILKVNKSEWILLLLGAIGSVLTGAVIPIFAFLYAQIFSVWKNEYKSVYDLSYYLPVNCCFRTFF